MGLLSHGIFHPRNHGIYFQGCWITFVDYVLFGKGEGKYYVDMFKEALQEGGLEAIDFTLVSRF